MEKISKTNVGYKPVDGCEECELNVEVLGAKDAGACNECILYGEAELVEIKND